MSNLSDPYGSVSLYTHKDVGEDVHQMLTMVRYDIIFLCTFLCSLGVYKKICIIFTKTTKLFLKTYLFVPRIGKFIERESRLELTRGWGGVGNGKLLFNGYRVSVWVDEKFLEMGSGDGCTTL